MDEHIVSGLSVLDPVEVVSVVERRRRWSVEVKGAIVVESFAAGATVAEVARRHGISQQHLQEWRRLARRGKLVLPGDGDLSFANVVVAEAAGGGAGGRFGDLQVEIGGAVIHVDGRSDLRLLKAVVQALRP